jgi:lysophospholipase L1-like esterase
LKSTWNRRAAAALAVLAVLGGLIAPGFLTGDSAAAAGVHFYLVLGGSEAEGYQPTGSVSGGAPTEHGYDQDLVDDLHSRLPDLQVKDMGCPAESTRTMVAGTGLCHPAAGSQLAEAVEFLHAHRDQVPLVTIDIGFNDIAPCIYNVTTIDPACVTQGIAQLKKYLPTILSELTAAVGRSTVVIGLTHYNPLLGDYLQPGSAALASESVGAINQLNSALISLYTEYHIPIANVAAVFDTTDTTKVHDGSRGLISKSVADICEYTFVCDGPVNGNYAHPTDRGYQLIASTIEHELDLAGIPDTESIVSRGG